MGENLILKHVGLQKLTNFKSKVYDLAVDEEEMTLGDFKKQAKKSQNMLGELTIEEFENAHWNQMKSHGKRRLRRFTPTYATDNDLSLFPSSPIGNLAKFGYKESIIHSVSCFLYFIIIITFDFFV